VFEEAIYAAVGHKKFGGRTFLDEALELFEEDVFKDESEEEECASHNSSQNKVM
jgi:hypothetical protein